MALVVTSRALNLPFTRRPARVDDWGAALLVAGVGALLLVGELERHPIRVGLDHDRRAGAPRARAGRPFVWYKCRKAEPILPPRLFHSGVVRVSAATSFIVGAAMFGALAFLPPAKRLRSARVEGRLRRIPAPSRT